jgi:hypothetical protein
MHTYNPNNSEDPECNKYTQVSVPGGSTVTVSFPRCHSNTTRANDLTLKQYLLDTDSGCSATSVQTQTICNIGGTVVALSADEIVKSDIPQASVIRSETYIVNEVLARAVYTSSIQASDIAFEFVKFRDIILAALGGLGITQLTDYDPTTANNLVNETATLASDFIDELNDLGVNTFNLTEYITDSTSVLAGIADLLDSRDEILDRISTQVSSLGIQNAIYANVSAAVAIARAEDTAAYNDVNTRVANLFQDITDIGDLKVGISLDGLSGVGKAFASVFNGIIGPIIDIIEDAIELGKGLFDGIDGFIDGLLDMFFYLLFFGVGAAILYVVVKLTWNKCCGNGYSKVDANAIKEMQEDIRQLQKTVRKLDTAVAKLTELLMR